MRRTAVFIASALISASIIPGLAAVSTLNKDVNAARTVRATVHSRPHHAADDDETCRAQAASFYQSVMRQQATVGRVDGARVLTAVDSVIDAFKDVFATKCAT
jgi:hypothetical protein